MPAQMRWCGRIPQRWLGAGRAARTARLEFQKETGVSLPPLPSEEVEEKRVAVWTEADFDAELALMQLEWPQPLGAVRSEGELAPLNGGESGCAHSHLRG